ncbi:MAG TPA: hypothetical protein VJ001_06100 [Rhodocyclaceae bacterium]|nr:hypothetical protein [Rhodocyclaceae bacterium]
MKRALTATALSLLFLAACGDSQHAAYVIGQNHSLTLTRQQDYYNGPWTTDLVVARFPACQRRHPLENLTGNKLKMEVYRPEPGVFILNSGKRWYVTETETCQFDQYKTPPPEPGEKIGFFQLKKGELIYVSTEEKPPEPGVAPSPPPAAPSAAPAR